MAKYTQRRLAAALLICGTSHAFPIIQPWRRRQLRSVSSSVRYKHKTSRSIRLQSQAIADTDTDIKTEGVETQPVQVSEASSQIDPLLTSFLLRSIRKRNSDDDNPTGDGTEQQPFFTFTDATKAMVGIQIWGSALRKARLPLMDDFSKNENIWPEEPLLSHVYDTLSELGLPRLIRRHPEILTSVLLGVAKVVIEFIKEQRKGKLVFAENSTPEEDDEYNWNDDDDLEEPPEFEYEPLSTEELDQLGNTLADNLKQEWGGVVQGVAMLDKVFGYDHGLLDMQGDSGFGIQDGIWQHSGWTPMPELQKRLSLMPELRELLLRLGRRPSAEGSDSRRFKQRKRSYSKDDMIGVELDPLDPTSVSGLTLGGSLATMLPSEAVFLRSSIRSLRMLFLAKKAESKLLSYELSGWTDVPTLPLPKARRSVTLPSASGGPLIICLDTSHSMSGMREDLSKAVVLASVTAAHAQGRDCRVVSFSSASNAVEVGNITCDAEGLRKLLDFLSYSFGGGTDVTGALKFAMDAMEDDMSSSDLLLVTDGELPNPPVSNVLLARLEMLMQQTGMEVHGLLVGKKESDSLATLCTEVHDFLGDYEGIPGATYTGTSLRSASTLSLPCPIRTIHTPSVIRSNCRRLPTRRFGFHLHASSQSDYEHDTSNNAMKLHKRGDKGKRRQFDDDDGDWEFEDIDSYGAGGAEPSNRVSNGPKQAVEDEYVTRVEAAMELLKTAVSKTIQDSKAVTEELQLKWEKSKILSNTISFVEEGLVERDLEARLVVLGMVSQEHVLFIGPPGTSKSEIGRRLSQLCGGPFFQRLFTRFTTPEEIFGPLSLKALENDQYVRCIEGFLPTATVAFLDEIFKANSAILNTLLTILNERKFDNGGGVRVSCPLKCVIGASNELPDSEELDALLDRFLLRSYVTSVSDEGLVKILSSKSLNAETAIDPTISGTLEEVVAEIATSLDGVSMNNNICILMRDMRSFLRDDLGIYVSDRRLVKAARLLKVSAASQGRDSVDFVDCLLLQHVMWQIPEQRDAIREWLWDNLTPGNDLVEQTRFILQGLQNEALELVKKTMGDVTGQAGAIPKDLNAIKSIQKEVSEIEKLLQVHSDELERHTKLLEDLPHHLWISNEDAYAAQQHLSTLASNASVTVNHALEDTLSLKHAITSDSIDNDIRASVIEMLTGDESDEVSFSEEEMQMSLKEAKKQFKGERLRQWKAARK